MRFALKITDNFLLEPVLHTFGVRPETSYLEIADGKLEVRMGIWFHESFALDNIARVAPSDWPWWGGLGVKLHHHGVGVVGSTEGVVNVQLKQAQDANVVVTVKASQLWLSLEDRDGFLRALGEACHVPVSEHTPF
ncbi:MAG: hypothetical protein ABJE95_40055 [Byssovorax sp.]